jgi:hypothetical protein
VPLGTRICQQIDPTLGWGNIGLDALEIKQILGTHLGILEEPNVIFLDQQMKAEIDKVTGNYQHRS